MYMLGGYTSPARHCCHRLCALQAQDFLTRQDWTIAREELQAYYNKDAPVHQRRCVIPTQVSSPNMFVHLGLMIDTDPVFCKGEARPNAHRPGTPASTEVLHFE